MRPVPDQVPPAASATSLGDRTAWRDATPADREAIERFLLKQWKTTRMISRGVEHKLLDLPALVAHQGTTLAGLATFAADRDGGCELVTLNATSPRQGLGSTLLAAVIERARSAGAKRLWLITTNDNLDAIRFYQRRGMRIVAVYPGAVDAARVRKPQIPLIGNYGIPLRDEIEFELSLS